MRFSPTRYKEKNLLAICNILLCFPKHPGSNPQMREMGDPVIPLTRIGRKGTQGNKEEVGRTIWIIKGLWGIHMYFTRLRRGKLHEVFTSINDIYDLLFSL